MFTIRTVDKCFFIYLSVRVFFGALSKYSCILKCTFHPKISCYLILVGEVLPLETLQVF